MNSILIIGTGDGGKSTTVTEICKELNPSKVYKLNTHLKKLEDTNVNDIYNNTFIIEANKKNILIVAGAPTEQGVMLKHIIEICIEIEIKISFAIISKRTIERKKGFNTIADINSLTKLVHIENVSRIPLIDNNDKNSFKANPIWGKRIEKLLKIVKENL